MVVIMDKKKIEEYLGKNKWDFVLKKGVLQYGVLFGALAYLVDNGFVYNAGELVSWLFFGVIGAGSFFGLTMWWYLNKKYKLNR